MVKNKQTAGITFVQNNGSQPGVIVVFLPWGTFGDIWRHFSFSQWKDGMREQWECCGHLVGRGQGSKHPTMHRQSP